MPVIPSRDTNVPTLSLAERAAELVLASATNAVARKRLMVRCWQWPPLSGRRGTAISPPMIASSTRIAALLRRRRTRLGTA